ncbi:MAG: sigma 54-interacting transcriptional regulator [Myxococcales bacterium]|nr:sigma 54-interacting transcriptional regulator [Myxococcales bacterium]MCB9673121.1 sigma 54-interacting transcriptional regulator [Alphaproteobacteria bacterium]
MTLDEDLALLKEALDPEDPEAGLALVRVGRVARGSTARDGEIARLRTMLARTPAILGATELQPAAEAALDGLIAALGARRGIVGLPDGAGLSILAARDFSSGDLDDPADQISRTVVDQVLRTGEPVVEDDARGAGAFAEQRSVRVLGLRSVLCLPFDTPGGRGFVYVDNHRVRGLFDAAALEAARAWVPLISSALSAVASRPAADPSSPFPGFLTRNGPLRERLLELARVARFDASVLLLGETGTGKSLLAQQIHAASPRRGGPMIHVNCGALPESLIEAELFGAKKGAFTGAVQDRQGRFQAAHGGTLFLDEINSMPEACQVKLLVALQERKVTPLGATEPVDVDVRVIAAMNDLQEGAGLREDLYFRLAVFPLTVPALRERPEDVPALAQACLTRIARRYGLREMHFAPEALETLVAHPWPGNVRELENAIDRAVLLAEDGVVRRLDLRASPSRLREVPAPVAVQRSPTPVMTSPALPSGRRVRSGVSEAEFLEAWEAAGGHAVTVAERLGVRERSVYRLKKRFLPD